MINDSILSLDKNLIPFIIPFFKDQVYFLILDQRQSQYCLYQVFRRKWAVSYLLSKGCQYNDLSKLTAQLMYLKNEYPELCLLSLNDDGKTHSDLLNTISTFQQSEEIYFTHNQWTDYKNTPLKPLTPDRFIRPSRLVFEGKKTWVHDALYFPLQKPMLLQLPGVESLCYFRLSLESKYQDLLPASKWFYLGNYSGQEIQLSFGIVPTPQGKDEWRVVVFSQDKQDEIYPEDIEPPGYSWLSENKHLGLIFDRTCIDDDKWEQAVAYLQGSKSSKSVHPRASQTIQQLPVRQNYSDLNASIRQGVYQSLEHYFEKEQSFKISLAWFADSANPRLVERKDLQPTSAAGAGPDIEVRKIRATVENCSFHIGLDLWDPIELALDELLKKDQIMPVIIIGNSPPTPSDLNDPLVRDILDASHTSIRMAHQEKSFEKMVKNMYQRGIPCFYLFLQDHQNQYQDYNYWFEFSQSIQLKVRLLLEKMVDIKIASAETKDIHLKLNEILEYLRTPLLSAIYIPETKDSAWKVVNG